MATNKPNGRLRRLVKRVRTKVNRFLRKDISASTLTQSVLISSSVPTDGNAVASPATNTEPFPATAVGAITAAGTVEPPGDDVALPEASSSTDDPQTEVLSGTAVLQRDSLDTAEIRIDRSPPTPTGPKESSLDIAKIQISSPSGTNVTISEALQSQFSQHSRYTPRWNQALAILRTEHQEDYKRLEEMISEETGSNVQRTEEFFQLKLPKKIANEGKSTQFLGRMKRYLPSLASCRAFVMAGAALDPWKVAPFVCASAFFAIDITLNTRNPEDLIKILDILLECGNIINEGISFEANFSLRNHPAITENLAELNDILKMQYIRALRLVSDIQHSYNSWLLSRWDMVTNVIVKWDTQMSELKSYKTKWSSQKKILDDKIVADDNISKVLDWIKKKDGSELSLDDIREKVTSGGRYKNSAVWFLNGPEFQSWSSNFQRARSRDQSNRVLWIKGGYGTGKTTIMYRTFSVIQSLAAFRGEVLRIVPYFCTPGVASLQRPDYESIIRSICRSLSFRPDFTLDPAAQTLHSNAVSSQGTQHSFTTPAWEGLLHKLLDGLTQSHIVFLVDGLDECKDEDEKDGDAAELLLDLMSKIIIEHSNVHLICSSHQQVRLPKYFQLFQEVNVTSSSTVEEMNVFIDGEIEWRRPKLEESIFFKENGLLRELKQALVDTANGMFVWVQIWFDILLRLHTDRRVVRFRDDAQRLLNEVRADASQASGGQIQLDAGFQRLWDLNNLDGLDKMRIRLFQLALSSSIPLEQTTLLEALSIPVHDDDDHSDHKDLTIELVERLYANFLYLNEQQVLGFVHDSAKRFVLNMKLNQGAISEDSGSNQFPERRNHLSFAKLFIEIMKQSSHPIWQRMGLDPSNWQKISASSNRGDRFLRNRRRFKIPKKPQNIVNYIIKFGLQHCFRAAKKRSIFDDLWMEVLNSVILSSDSAFAFVTLASQSFDNPEMLEPSSESTEFPRRFIPFSFGHVFREHEGSLEMLYTHVLAVLDIIGENDILDSQLGNSEQGGCDKDWLELLFKHAACKGGDIFGDRGVRSSTDQHGVTALTIACQNHNHAAVRMILQASHHFSGKATSIDLLFGPKRMGFATPICIAFVNSDIGIARTLLEFEKQYINTAKDGLQQWSQRCQLTGITAVTLAVGRLKEDEIRDLLIIAHPSDINVQDEDGNSALHVAAAKGYHQLVQDLVETYKATIEIFNNYGYTPAFLASYCRRQITSNYLESKGAIVKFETRHGQLDLLKNRKLGLYYIDRLGDFNELYVFANIRMMVELRD